MKLLTIAVPSYNSEDYLARCLDTLVQGGPELEVIVIDDGSTDRTAALAGEYAARYPNLVRVISKPNGGHGSGVNRGLLEATGLYYRVVDSDDWVDVRSLHEVLNCLRAQAESPEPVDLLITNFVYEYVADGSRHTMHYHGVFPETGQILRWHELKPFKLTQLLLMHSLTYRTAVLRESGLQLPEHTFYVDHLFAYVPLPFTKRLIYLDLDFYRYFIGRDDQSVSTPNLIKRIDQHLLVADTMMRAYHLEHEVEDHALRRYMYRYLAMVFAICEIHLVLSREASNLAKIKKLWQNFRAYDEPMARKTKRHLVCRAAGLPGAPGRFIARHAFYLVRRIFKFS